MRLSESQLRKLIRKALLTEKKWADLDAPKGTTIPLSPDDFEEEEWEKSGESRTNNRQKDQKEQRVQKKEKSGCSFFLFLC